MDINNFLLDTIKREMTRSRHPFAVRAPSLYPSSASAVDPNGNILGSCQRADWYRIHGIPPSDATEFYMQMIYALGKSVENEVVDAMKKAGIYEANGTKFYHADYGISGELDVVGRYRPQPDKIGYYLVEVKSVYGIGATKTITGRSKAYKGQPSFAPYPKESNLMQVMIYIDYFDGTRGPASKLDFCKLLYIPRDKPNDGREYTVSLVKLADLTEEMQAQYKDIMDKDLTYALVQTEGFPDAVETRFTLEGIYDRFRSFREDYLDKGISPPRSFAKFYKEAEIEKKYLDGDVSTTAYEVWTKSGKPTNDIRKTPGHYLCQTYCDWRSFCFKRDGSPNEKADKVGVV